VKSGGRHAAPVRRPAAGLILLLAGVLVTLAGATGIIVSSAEGRSAYAAGPIPHVAVPRGPIEQVPDSLNQGHVPGPIFLVIPAIGVRTRLIKLGTTSDGAMAVPTTTKVAGWYTASPRPGAIGSAVIAGHVDSYQGPGVFFRLHLLRPGDRAFVLRGNGTLAVFRITEVREYRKAAFPNRVVYGPVPYAGLRLITCGGTFDPSTRSYLSNVVVYSQEVGPRKL
jgi:sortase (surface protein transpeptidase)